MFPDTAYRVYGWLLAWDLIKSIASNGRPKTDAQIFGPYQQPITHVSEGDNTTTLPDRKLWHVGDTRFMALSGLRSLDHVRNLLLGFNDLHRRPGQFGMLPTLEPIAENLLDQLDSGLPGDGGNFFIAGHSYGGALAICLTALLRVHRPQANVVCVTFGSPRVGNQRFTNSSYNWNIARLFARDDPVPFVLPWSTESPFGHLVPSQEQSRGIDDGRQCYSGYEIHADGGFAETPYPTAVVLPKTISLFAWLSGIALGREVVHNVPAYDTLMQRMRLVQGSAVPEPIATRPHQTGQEAPETPLSGGGEHDYGDAVVRTDAIRRLAPEIPKRFQYMYQRERFGYSVLVGDRVIAWFHTRQQARAYCRSANRFQRYQLQALYTFPAELNAAQDDFLKAAMDDGVIVPGGILGLG